MKTKYTKCFFKKVKYKNNFHKKHLYKKRQYANQKRFSQTQLGGFLKDFRSCLNKKLPPTNADESLCLLPGISF